MENKVEKISNAVLRRFCEGDNTAISEVYTKLNDTVVGWASSHIGEYFKIQDAEQAASEAWLKVLKTKHTLRDHRTAVSFIKRVTNNCCLDMLRKKNVRREETLEKESPEYGSFRNEIECSHSGNPEDNMVNLEEMQILRSLIASLDPIYYEALTGFLEDRSYAAIAEQCDCPLGTAKRRIHHAKKMLMERSEYLREV